MRRQVHLQRAFGMAKMKLQRERGNDQESQSCKQSKPVRRLHFLHAKNPLERRQDKGPGDQSGEKRIKNNEDAPLERSLIGIYESFHNFFFLTGPNRRGCCKTASSQSRDAASRLAPCASSERRESDRWDFSGRPIAARPWGMPRN